MRSRYTRIFFVIGFLLLLVLALPFLARKKVRKAPSATPATMESVSSASSAKEEKPSSAIKALPPLVPPIALPAPPPTSLNQITENSGGKNDNSSDTFFSYIRGEKEKTPVAIIAPPIEIPKMPAPPPPPPLPDLKRLRPDPRPAYSAPPPVLMPPKMEPPKPPPPLPPPANLKLPESSKKVIIVQR